MTDTHTHLYVSEFDVDRYAAVQRALNQGVTRMVMPNIDLDSIEPMRALASLYPDNMFMAMGLHPTELPDDWQAGVDTVLAELRHHRADYVAVGEIGIDLYWDKSRRDIQMQAFDMQLAAARAESLPVIIHCRDGLDEVLEVMKDYKDVPAVFHCFGGTADDVDRIRRIGDYYFGIGGVVTFRNSRLRDILSTIGIDRILLETDSPYLAPVPMRGRRNETSFITNTASCIASVLDMSIESVADSTDRNADALFGLDSR